MLLVEMVMQRDLSLNVKEAVFKVGFVCIMVIVAFAIYNDISKILPGGLSEPAESFAAGPVIW